MLLKDINIKRYLQVQFETFQAVGIDITSLEHTLQRPWLLYTTGLGAIVIILAFANHSLTHTGDLNSMAASLSLLLECLLGLWKMCIFVYQRKPMVDLIQRIHQGSLEEMDLEEYFSVLVEENTRDIVLSRFYQVSVISAGTVAMVAQFFVSGFIFIRTGNFTLEPPLTGSYIVDTTVPLNYVIVYLLSICLVVFVLCASVGVDSLFSWYVHNLVGHFRILQLRLKHLPSNVTNEHFLQVLKKHQRNLVFADTLDRLLRPIIFGEFTLNSAQICFIAYQILRGVTTAGFPFLICFLAAVALQIMIYCYGGQRLEDESKAIASVLSGNTNWTKWSLYQQKYAQFVIMRAQKPCKVTGLFFVVNYPLFLWVTRTAASIMTLLSSLD